MSLIIYSIHKTIKILIVMETNDNLSPFTKLGILVLQDCDTLGHTLDLTYYYIYKTVRSSMPA